MPNDRDQSGSIMKNPVIITLGAGLVHTTQYASPNEWIGENSARRAAAAATLWQQHPDAMLIFSGGHSAGPHSPSEAEAMSEYVQNAPWNIPPHCICTENDSCETAGNVRNVVKLLRKMKLPCDNIILIAGQKNLKRAASYFRALGVIVTLRFVADILKNEVPEDITPSDLLHERILGILQLVDRRGYLPTCIKHWQMRRK